MKKYFGMIISMVFIGLLTIIPNSSSYSIKECEKEYQVDLKLNQLSSFVNSLDYNYLIEICTNDYCSSNYFLSTKKTIEQFQKEYEQYVKLKYGEDQAYEVSIRSINIISIKMNTCY